LKEAAKKAATVVAAPKGSDAKGGKKEEKAKVEEKPKEEEPDMGTGGLFGDDGY